jgi:TonB family protein
MMPLNVETALKIVPFLWFSASGMAQTADSTRQADLPNIAPEVAKGNLVGLVRLSIVIDEQGSVKAVTLISGHPMLAPATIEAVRKWRYKPFQIEGKTAAVQTVVQISIPENISQSDIEKGRKFQEAYWPNERAGRDALQKGDLVTAEAKLDLARTAAEERGDEKWLELADSISMLAGIKERQEDYPAAESMLKESLAIHRKHQKADEAEVASAEFQLAALYVQLQRPTEAEPLLVEAIRTWELRIADTPMSEAKIDYEWNLALSYFAAARIAGDSNHSEDARLRCERATKLAEQNPGKPYMNDVTSRCASIQNKQ